MQAKANGKTDDEVKSVVDAAVATKRSETIEVCKTHLRASIARLESSAQIQRRLALSENSSLPDGEADGQESDLTQPTIEQTELEVAVAADNLEHTSQESDRAEGAEESS